MNRSQYLVSALNLFNIKSRHFASLRGKMDFREKMLWSNLKSIFRDLPPASLSAAPSKHCLNLNINGTTLFPKLYSTSSSCSSLRCFRQRQRLCPDLVTRRPQYFQQERRRTCHSWTSSISERETVSGAVTKLMEKFEKEDIPESDVSAEYIVAHVLGVRQVN